ALACAENIEKTGLGKQGGWTGIAVDTCKEWPIFFWGLIASGRNALLLDPSLDDEGIAHLMRQAGADSLITRRKRELPCEQRTPEEVLGTSDAPGADYEPKWANLIAACTSGTTSTSRVYVYDGKAICRQIIGFSRHELYPCLTSEEFGPLRVVAFLPFNHIFGLIANLITMPFQNQSQIFLKDRAPQTILETARKCDAKVILTVPLLVNSISSTIKKRVAEQSAFKRGAFKVMQSISLTCQRINPLWGLKVGKKLFKSVNKNLFGDGFMEFVVGGAHTPEEHLRTVNALGYAVTVGFGMTETAITSYENKIDLKTRLSGSVGLPLPITEYKVRPDGNDPNHGELLIRCDAMHIGRMADGVMVPPVLDEDGYFATGDVVRIGDKGRMWIEGRIKDVIIGESGENVYPDEIEDTFAGMEGVEQLAVFCTKPKQNELVTAMFNIGDRYEDKEFISKLSAELDKRNKTLQPLKRLKAAYVTSQPLPVVSAIKIKRAALREGIEKGTFPCKRIALGGVEFDEEIRPAGVQPKADEGEDLEELKAKIKKCFAKELEIDESLIKDDSTFSDELGGDSLHRLGALLRVEEEFGVQIPENAYEGCTTVRDLSVLIKKLREEKKSAK
ncbi:MAG: AMP-binding protein, partial [Clostridia bacterium]|nr:AMP-binding protein [Clostridia bacterium]